MLDLGYLFVFSILGYVVCPGALFFLARTFIDVSIFRRVPWCMHLSAGVCALKMCYAFVSFLAQNAVSSSPYPSAFPCALIFPLIHLLQYVPYQTVWQD